MTTVEEAMALVGAQMHQLQQAQNNQMQQFYNSVGGRISIPVNPEPPTVDWNDPASIAKLPLEERYRILIDVFEKDGGKVSDQTAHRIPQILKSCRDDYKAMMERIEEGGMWIGVIVGITNKHVFINSLAGDTIAKYPEFAIKIGDTVLIHPQSQQIIHVMNEMPMPTVEAAVVFDGPDYVLIEAIGKKLRVPKPPELRFGEDEVALLEKDMRVVIGKGKGSTKHLVSEPPSVTWADIGGLEHAKAELQEAMDSLTKHGDIYKRFNKRPIKGILLFGSPGCGKTMLAKACANQIIGEYASVDGAFIYVKGPEILDMFVGNSESKIRDLFKRTKAFNKKTGRRGVLFVDEAEAILGHRGNKYAGGHMSATTVPSFLAEWDGLEDTGALVILATNRANDLDEAIMREGRIDRKIAVLRPDVVQSAEIFYAHLGRCPCVEGRETMAIEASRLLFGSYARLVKKVSGAMIANLVDRATSLAIKRAVELKEAADGGLVFDDLGNAMALSDGEYASLG